MDRLSSFLSEFLLFLESAAAALERASGAAKGDGLAWVETERSDAEPPAAGGPAGAAARVTGGDGDGPSARAKMGSAPEWSHCSESTHLPVRRARRRSHS